MRHVLALAILPIAAACHEPECSSPQDVQVVAASATPDSSVDTVRAAIDRFAGWTGGQGVCVDTVFVTDALPDPTAAGMVDAEGAWIRLSDEGAGEPTLEARTFHQLCHAADHALGLSDGTLDDEEAFAKACALGPKAAEEKAYTVCEAGDPAATALLEDLFVGHWPQQIAEGDWHFDDAVGSVGLSEDGVVVPAGDGAAILDWATDAAEATPALRIVDEAGTHAAIDGPTIAATTGWQLFGGGGEHPVLLLRNDNGSHAVQFDLDAGIAVYVPVPRTLALDEAVVAHGALYGAGSVDGTYGAWRVDLDTGDAAPWSTPTLVERPLASHGRIALPHGTDVLVYDIAADDWHAWPLPLELNALDAMPDAAGSLSVRWTHTDARGLARLSAPMGTVQLDVEACGDSIASDTQGTWVAGSTDAAWSAPDRTAARLDVLHVSFE